VNHIMIDLETMGNGSAAAIVSIGAVAFDLEGEPPAVESGLLINVDLASSMAKGLRADASTIMWWLRQSQEARDALLSPPPVQIWDALSNLSSFIRAQGPSPRIWAHATFDLPILSSAYRAVGLRQPWQYTHSRDVRTIYELAYGSEQVPGIPTDQKHNALYDAWRQAIGVQTCWRRLHPAAFPGAPEATEPHAEARE